MVHFNDGYNEPSNLKIYIWTLQAELGHSENNK